MLEIRKNLQMVEWEREKCRSDLRNTEWALRIANIERRYTEEAKSIILQAAIDTRGQIKLRIEDLVTSAIASIVPPQKRYKFNMDFSDGGGVEFWLESPDGKTRSPFSVGGGIVDAESVGLRFSVWFLSGLRPTIVLDEPFRNLSPSLYGEEARKKASALLAELAHSIPIQIICITHDPDLIAAADDVISINMGDDGVSTIS